MFSALEVMIGVCQARVTKALLNSFEHEILGGWDKPKSVSSR
jgi:hypothetical protein